MGKGARARRVRAAQAGRMAEAQAAMGAIAAERFSRPPWEAYREVERHLPPGHPDRESALLVVSLIPFGVRGLDQGSAPSGSGSLAMLADLSNLPTARFMNTLEMMVAERMVFWAQSSHTVVMTVPVPA